MSKRLEYLSCPRCRWSFSPNIPGHSRNPVARLEKDGTWKVGCARCKDPAGDFPFRINLQWRLLQARPTVHLVDIAEILEQPGLKKSPDASAWLAVGPLEPLKCQSCKESFTETPGAKPLLLQECGHMICENCHAKTPGYCQKCTTTRVPCKDADLSLVYSYQRDVGCSLMEELDPDSDDADSDDTDSEEDESGEEGEGKSQEESDEDEARTEVGREIAKLVHSQVECARCLTKCSASTLVVCRQCEDVILCGACIIAAHIGHALVPFTQARAELLETSTRKDLHMHFDGLFANIFGIHETIVENQSRLLQFVENGLKLLGAHPDFEKSHWICWALRRAAEEYEKKFELYLPHARIYNADLETLQDILDNILQTHQPE